MNALSQHKLGKHDNGTNLQKAVDMCPMDHFKKKGVAGVIYVPLGSRPAARPLTTSGQGLKVAGMTEAARDRVKSTPIKDLDMPIVASGYIYDGTWDALSVSMGDNEIAFGKNENDQVWVNGHGDAFDGLKKAAGRTDATVAARLILEEDIGTLTLAKARVE